jgi:large subunit ribosomal protein L5
MARLKERYEKEILLRLMEELGVKNRLRVPRLLKIVVNMGIGAADKDVLKKCSDQLAIITGQKAVLTKARKSISNFKLRQGMIIGAKVTLRGARMYEFLDRLINAALPRIRDFRGLPPSAFDGKGNCTMGVKEQTIFPEIEPDDASTVQGMDITIVTSSDSDKEAFELLKRLGMPFSAN